MNKKQVIALTGVLALTGSVLLMNSRISIPKNVKPITPFDADRYLGKWYEVARLDFRFERNLNNTTANYSLNGDGSIKVVNQGYNYVKKQWEEAKGKIRFVGNSDVARLKVSFFGPFYAAYNVVELDDEYQYALIIGKSSRYCWILSRTPSIPDDIKEKYIASAKRIGVEVEELIWVKHDKK